MKAWLRCLKPSEQLFLSWGVLMHVLAFFYATGYQHGDEHFQIIEFAAYKLGLCTYESLAWEYPAQMRPGLQPLMVYGTANLTRLINGNFDAFLVSDILRAFSLLLGIASLFLMHRLASVFHLKANQSVLLAFFLGLSWFFPYLHARFSSENYSGIFLVFAVFFAFRNGIEKADFKALNWFLSGILWGMAFEFRFQIGFAAIGFAFWLMYYKKLAWIPFLSLLIGGTLVLLMSLFIDHWLYNEWCFPPYNYFNQVLFKTDSMFGRNPWYDFLPLSLNWLGLSVGVLFLISLGYSIKKGHRNPLVWMFVFFVAVHCLLDHKEMRFLFPAVYLTPLLLAAALPDWILDKGKDLFLTQLKLCFLGLIVFLSVVKSFACSATYASPDVNTFRELSNYIDKNGPTRIYCPYDIGYVMAHYYEFRFFRKKGAILGFYSNDNQLKSQVKFDQQGLIIVWGNHTAWPDTRSCKLIYDSLTELQFSPYLRGKSWNRDRYRIYQFEKTI